MAIGHRKERAWLMRAALCAVAAVALAGCAETSKLNPMAEGPINPASPVAGDIVKAEHTPGPYPTFLQVPPVPKDVRPASAWRASVAETLGWKRQTQAEAAAIPFTLVVGDADSWAQVERAKIPASEMDAPATDASQQAEAFAAAARARATPPPPPN